MKLSYEKRELLERELAKLYAKHGVLAPSILVEEAQNPEHPLHEGFGWIWDDKRAAHAQRLGHARNLIASVKVEVIHERRMICAPVYVHDPRAEKQGYVKLDSIKDDRAVAIEALKTEVSRAIRYVERAKAVAHELELDDELRARLETAGIALLELTKLASVA